MNVKPQGDPRQRLYKLLNVARRELRLPEDQYRSVLYANGAKLVDDKWSASTMSIPQLEAALEQLKRLGFKPKAAKVKRFSDWRRPRIAKLRALWMALADAGVVRDRSDRALAKFCARHTGVAKPEWADSQGLNKAVEALKDWARREHVRLTP